MPGPTLPVGTITEFTIPAGNGPSLIAPGPGGNIWFSLDDGGVLAYMNPTTGTFTDPAYAQQTFVISGLTSGMAPDYDLYLTDDVHDQIGEVSSIGQPIITFGPFTGSTETPLDQPLGITVGANNIVWFTEYDGSEIGAAQLNTPPPTTTALQAASTLQLSASVTAAYPGETVKVTAVVVPSSVMTNPTGYVTFFINGQQQTPVCAFPNHRRRYKRRCVIIRDRESRTADRHGGLRWRLHLRTEFTEHYASGRRPDRPFRPAVRRPRPGDVAGFELQRATRCQHRHESRELRVDVGDGSADRNRTGVVRCDG